MSTTNANQPQHGESKSQGSNQGSQSTQGAQGQQGGQGHQGGQGSQGQGSQGSQSNLSGQGSQGSQGSQGQQRGSQQGGQRGGQQGSGQRGGQGGGSQHDLSDMQDQVEEIREDFAELVSNVSDAVQRYYSARPGVAAATLFGLGFFVGWKLKPW